MSASDSNKSANRLAGEKSPYLLQHAHNPVDWYPWGDEAFAKARNENKLILLSIGYATCHWCHVMERESFEDQTTAEILNQNFISIKVDREERPDVDRIYMRALQMIGQQGGWPLNMWLTPDLKPITGGTYFPPQPMHGRPSFIQALQAMQKMWQENPQKITESATHIFQHLVQANQSPAKKLPDVSILDAAVETYFNGFDKERGGFYFNGPNKFPPSMILMFLMRRYRQNKDERCLQMATGTLQAMRLGGIYDQIGGGLSRYSTDHDWLVPHFEKMLYDNALFAQAIIEAYRLTEDTVFKEWCRDVFQYIERDMTSPEGAFYSAEDADSEGVEGKFYVWDHAELRSLLQSQLPASLHIPPETASRLSDNLLDYWGVQPGGNFEGLNILNVSMPLMNFVRERDLEIDEFRNLLNVARTIILKERNNRIRPLKDDKVLLSWNAMMISAYAQASIAFKDRSLLQTATRAIDFIFKNMRTEDGALLRRYRDGEARHQAGLSDYAQLAQACLDLYRAGGDQQYFTRALQLEKQIQDLFIDQDQNIYDTAANQDDLIMRTSDNYDGVEPAGLSALIQIWLSLASYGVRSTELHNQCQQVFLKSGESLEKAPIAHPWLLLAYDRFKKTDPEIAIALPETGETITEEWSTEARFMIDQKIGSWSALAIQKFQSRPGQSDVPLLEHRKALGADLPGIYYCENMQCQQPVSKLTDLDHLLITE